MRALLLTGAAMVSVAFGASPSEARYLQTDPIGYEDGMNLYAYVGNDPLNAVDPLGLYKCGKNLSESQCAEFEKVQDRAIKSLETRLNTLEGAKESLENGDGLTDAQNSALSDLNTFFGTEGEGVEGVNTALRLGNAILGELKGDKPAVLGRHDDLARSELGGRLISLGRPFWSAGRHDQTFTLVHEAAHTSRVAPRDFGVNLPNGRTIRPYGMRNAILRGRYAPSSTTRHPDSIPYALGFRRNKR